MAYPEPLEALIDAFQRLPGIGRRSAERLAFHILRDPESRGLAQAIERASKSTRRCRLCCNVSETELCGPCADESRDPALLCVVEEPRHVEAIERAGVFRGRYHVLMGALHPAEGTEAHHLTLKALLARLGGESEAAGEVRELILATDPDAEGEATAALVLEAVDGLPARREGRLRVTRLARGLPAGSAIEYLHRGVLEDALEGRREVGPRGSG